MHHWVNMRYFWVDEAKEGTSVRKPFFNQIHFHSDEDWVIGELLLLRVYYFLPALRDAVYYVKRLHEEHGYRFHCITSLSLDPNAQRLREMNLHKLFGATAFERVVCLDTGAHKDDALEEYEGTGCYWIEDKPENAEAGYQVGLNPLIVEHGHNMHYYHEHIPLVKNWKHIFEIITRP